jgi:hypothetical protein
MPSFEEYGRELFEAAYQHDLEGIVAKRKADPYGPNTAWYKLKNPTYTQAAGRGELFQGGQRFASATRGNERREPPHLSVGGYFGSAKVAGVRLLWLPWSAHQSRN